MAESAEQSIKSLQKAVKDARNELAKLERGTEDYNKVLDKLAQSQNKLNEINADARAVTQNLTELYSNASSAVAGFAGGVQAAASTMELFGIQTDSVGESLVRLQALQGVVSGFTSLSQGIKAAGTALRGLNLTFLASPIGLIITAVALLIGYFGDLRKEFSFIIDPVMELWDQLTDLFPVLKDTSAVFDIITQVVAGLATAIIRLATGPIKALVKILKGDFKGAWNEVKNAINVVQNFDDGYTRQSAINAEKRLETVENEVNKSGQLRADELEKQRQAELEAEKRFNDLKVQLADEAAQRAFKAMDKYDRADIIETDIELSKQLQDQFLRTANEESKTNVERADALERYREALNTTLALEAERGRILQEIADEEEARDNAEAERIRQMTELQQMLEKARNPEELTAQEQIDRLREEAEAQWALANDFTQSYEARKAALTSYYNLKKQGDAAEMKLEQEKKRVRDSTFNAYASVLSDTAGLLAENTVASKVLSVASATIGAWAGASQTLGDPELPFYAKLPAALTILTTGLQAVKNIASTDVPGASDSTTASTTPTIPSVPQLRTPIQETHNNLSGYDEDFFNGVQTVLVVEDLDQVQNRVDVKEYEASHK